ncbi:hypothetical protein DV737_g5641, partial [Chaetothyriales sp. CBS 132003]
MDEYTADIFASHYDDDDESVAAHSLNHRHVHLPATDAEAEWSRASSIAPCSGNTITERAAAANSLQDRLLSRLLQQVIPADNAVDDDDATTHQPSPGVHVLRPTFSLPIMTSNFRRFNARIGVVFVFQDQVVDLFSWKHPSHTLSFLATYSFVCLNPYLIVALPLAVTLLFIMVPAFLSRHPPPPPQAATSSTTPYYSTYNGPALAPARTIKPASETSIDFFRNIRYLQNSMADFANLYDLLNATIAPASNFSDEVLSSTIFISLFLLTLCLFITAHLLPWRLVALVGGNAAIVSLHPVCQEWLLQLQKDVKSQSSPPSQPDTAADAPLSHVPQKFQPLVDSLSSITLSSTPETREVEVFELQHRPLSSFSPSGVGEWKPYLFTPTPYDPLSPVRISGDRPKGTRFFEDVQPPEGWEFHSKKWELDMDAGEWVNERIVVGVEYDVLNKAEDDEDDVQTARPVGQSSSSRDFGGWVWDLPPPPGQAGRDEEVWLAYGDYSLPDHDEHQPGRNDTEATGEKDWEESVRYGNSGRTGEWRRRRWVRLVRRKWVSSNGPETRDIFAF